MEGSFRQRKTKLHKLPFSTAHVHFTAAQIVINCTLKYALIRCEQTLRLCLDVGHSPLGNTSRQCRAVLPACLLGTAWWYSGKIWRV